MRRPIGWLLYWAAATSSNSWRRGVRRPPAFLLVTTKAEGGEIEEKTPAPFKCRAEEGFDWRRGSLAPASERATGSGWGQSGAGRADRRTVRGLARLGSMDPAPGGSYRRRLLLLSPASPASPAVVKSLFPADLSPVSDLRLTMEQLGRGSVRAGGGGGPSAERCPRGTPPPPPKKKTTPRPRGPIPSLLPSRTRSEA